MGILMETVNYYKLPHTSRVSTTLTILAYSTRDWINYYNFKAIRLPNDLLFSLDPFLKKLYKKHKFHAGIIKLDPNTYYDWHTDTNRGVSINMLLNFDGHHHCLFTQDHGKVTGKFKELVYEPHTYYLFNNQETHSVYNYDAIRFLFSIEFEETKESLSFNDLLKEFCNG